MKGKMYHRDEFIGYPAIYFLIDSKDKILYIGKSNNIQNRIESHKKRNVIPYTKVFVYNVPEIHLNWREKYFILKYRPIFNTEYLGVSLRRLELQSGVSKRHIGIILNYIGMFPNKYGRMATRQVDKVSRYIMMLRAAGNYDKKMPRWNIIDFLADADYKNHPIQWHEGKLKGVHA